MPVRSGSRKRRRGIGPGDQRGTRRRRILLIDMGQGPMSCPMSTSEDVDDDAIYYCQLPQRKSMKRKCNTVKNSFPPNAGGSKRKQYPFVPHQRVNSFAHLIAKRTVNGDSNSNNSNSSKSSNNEKPRVDTTHMQ